MGEGDQSNHSAGREDEGETHEEGLIVQTADGTAHLAYEKMKRFKRPTRAFRT